MENRISWDEYFMAQSHLLSLRSTCSRLSVGATIVRDKELLQVVITALLKEMNTA